LIYLITFGSVAGFTAYVWLLHHRPPSQVSTYAYVNPVIAVALGYFVAGERIGVRTVLGTLMILASVITIMTTKTTRSQTSESASEETDLNPRRAVR
jgi:drug/metabolite transporter (DMT)-like permease